MERLQAADLKQIATVEAIFVYNAAQRDQMIPRKPLPNPVDRSKRRREPIEGIFPGADSTGSSREAVGIGLYTVICAEAARDKQGGLSFCKRDPNLDLQALSNPTECERDSVTASPGHHGRILLHLYGAYQAGKRARPRPTDTHLQHHVRGVAQPGRAPGSGPGGRRFKSSLPDH